MTNSITAIGVVITFFNAVTVGIVVWNIVYSYNKASDIHKAVSAEDVKYYFRQILTSMIFLVANAIATYTGFLTYIIHPYVSLDTIVYWRAADRFSMFCVACTLLWNSKKYTPFTS